MIKPRPLTVSRYFKIDVAVLARLDFNRPTDDYKR